MIAHICAFTLCCFAITLKIKTIESAGNNQIIPVRFFIQSCREDYVHTVNDLKTFNRRPIGIKPADLRNLTNPAIDNIQEYKSKLKSRDRLEKKAEDIKCSFCAIAKSNILFLKNLVEKLKNGIPFINNEGIVERLKQEVEMMIQLLLTANLETGKWLWSYLLKIVAITQYYDNTPFIHENPFEDEQLQTGISDFIGTCTVNKYLPPAAMESDFVLKNRSVYENMFRVLRRTGWFSDILLGRDLVTVEFLYLKPFWDDQRQLLFRPITQVDVDWSRAKHRHDAEVVITREFVQNRLWIYHPYGRLDHQHLLINIIDARIYCHLSVILYVYEKQISILDEQTLMDIKILVYDVIFAAMSLTSFKDDFLVVILSEFGLSSIINTDDIKDILARVRTRANEILNGLNGASTSRIDRLTFNVDNERQLPTNDLIIRIIKNLEDYLTEFNNHLPFEYKSFLHFMDAVKMPAAQYI
ncbi:uncharacterized protein LOC126836825 [Adelges cooleyi]|uniref:uncharacterized protein LOC126836825 n=1 Tax=Adelges cooleyi TaxID=133065 RepID=UPI00217FB143|nr:uncharacterized protein LOC126836825 [Adelges cooleyi]